jgi:hypothetical protein
MLTSPSTVEVSAIAGNSEAPDPGVIGNAGEDLAEALRGFEERAFIRREQGNLGLRSEIATFEFLRKIANHRRRGVCHGPPSVELLTTRGPFLSG